jgi:hypothetical protein
MTEEKLCRHEYVTIFQRRLKGLERRLMATRAYLPVGFKQADLAHLGEGSFAFCKTCRARLYPRRTVAEKAAARQVLLAGKLLAAEEAIRELSLERETTKTIDVEELEVEAVDVEDIEAEGVKLSTDEVDSSCDLTSDEFI